MARSTDSRSGSLSWTDRRLRPSGSHRTIAAETWLARVVVRFELSANVRTSTDLPCRFTHDGSACGAGRRRADDGVERIATRGGGDQPANVHGRAPAGRRREVRADDLDVAVVVGRQPATNGLGREAAV